MNTIYIRTLKRAEHGFDVADGQKTYYDVQFTSHVLFQWTAS